MSSLLSQLEVKNNNFEKIQYKNTQTQKSQKSKQDLASYAVAVPVFSALGAYCGNDVFLKEKKAAQQAVDQASKWKLTVKESDFRDKMLSAFSDLVVRLKEDRPTEMPNCLMVKGTDPLYCEKMIDWIGKTGNANFVKITNEENIVGHLEMLEENYHKTKEWSLLYIKNMDDLINHKKASERVVEGMKDIMSAAADDYHTTIIFSTAHPEKLDQIALQPHRVKKPFVLDNIDQNLFFENDRKIEALKERVKKLTEVSKKQIRNTKILKMAAIGCSVGVAAASAINYGIKYSKNIRNKERKG